MQMEWTTAFPSHRILGGAPSTSSSTAGPPQFNRFAGTEGDDLDVNMLDDLGVNAPDETSESKAKHALRALDLSKPATDNILHPEMRRELFKIHRNLGHPSLQVFVRALKHAGVKNEVLQWTKNHFKCPLCERKQQPSSHRPGKLQRAMNFNEVVGVDLIQINVPEIGDYWMLNCLCWGTDYADRGDRQGQAGQHRLGDLLPCLDRPLWPTCIGRCRPGKRVHWPPVHRLPGTYGSACALHQRTESLGERAHRARRWHLQNET